jgi:predicted nucleotidyltransferase
MNQKKINQKIKEITKKIVEGFQPEKIILFGSWVWGKPTKDSDVDLLIIKRTRKNKHQRTDEVFDLIYNQKDFGKGIFNIPIEPHIYTPQEIKRRISLGDFFIKEIFEQGRVIYEK